MAQTLDDLDQALKTKTPEELLDMGLRLRGNGGYLDGVKSSVLAFAFLKAAADRGDFSEAHLALGHMYENGQGVALNEKEAKNSYARATAAGDPQGNLEMARMFLRGDEDSRHDASGNKKAIDDKIAFRLTAVAALAGLSEAKFRLGMMFDAGIGVQQNIPRAVSQLCDAASQGHPTAVTKLVTLHEELTLGKGRNLQEGFGKAISVQIPGLSKELAAQIEAFFDAKSARDGKPSALVASRLSLT